MFHLSALTYHVCPFWPVGQCSAIGHGLLHMPIVHCFGRTSWISKGPKTKPTKSMLFCWYLLVWERFGWIMPKQKRWMRQSPANSKRTERYIKIPKEHLQHQQPISACEACVLALSISMSLNYSWASPFLCLQSSFVLLGYMRSLVRRS